LVHFPRLAAWLQDTHVPVHAMSQQTWSEQWAFWHSASAMQAAPLGFRPHELFMHVAPATQSVLAAHVALQLVASLHTNGAHVIAVGVTHMPDPSQADCAVTMLLVELQAASLQGVPSDHIRQAPWPSQVPSCWQVVFASVGQAGCPVSGAEPFKTGEHFPTLPIRLQA
jgi:hypothetical protein